MRQWRDELAQGLREAGPIYGTEKIEALHEEVVELLMPLAPRDPSIRDVLAAIADLEAKVDALASVVDDWRYNGE